MLKSVKFTAEYNRWTLEEMHRDPESGRWFPNLNKGVRYIRLFWRIQFKGFFIHIGRDTKNA